uniref:Coiled-coil domain containing 112 n=1 Tax=Labrus bergylta TaxID=56723 RepID=A0A3Q3ERM8_9LABR
MEKERTLSVQCKRNGWTDVCRELDECEKEMEAQRNAEKINLQKQLVKIHNGVRRFQRQLTDVKPTPARNFEELFKEERTCRQEITACEKKIENWSLAVQTNEAKHHAAPTVKVCPALVSLDLPAEVRALEVFLQKTGGQYGGWDQYDHQAFLKVWTKHGGQPAYRKEAKLYLPAKTWEEIEQHEDWHQELIYLQDRKREVDNCKHEERRRQLEVKLTIEEQLRLRREDEQEQERRRREEEQREMDERRKAATKGIKRFNERVDGHVSRDASRLTRPTQGWKERMKNIGPSGGGPVLQMFHRAVPTWRQGL